MTVVLAVAGIAAADCDVDALKAVLEKVTDAETQCRIGNCSFNGPQDHKLLSWNG